MRFPEKIQYGATATWDKETGGSVKSGDYVVKFDTPERYGGMGRALCPDQLFLASITGCLMDTFLNFKKRLEVETLDVIIEAVMDIEMQGNEGYRIKEIRVVIKVVAPDGMINLNRNCAELAFNYCHIIQSIKDSFKFTNLIEVQRGQEDIFEISGSIP